MRRCLFFFDSFASCWIIKAAWHKCSTYKKTSKFLFWTVFDFASMFPATYVRKPNQFASRRPPDGSWLLDGKELSRNQDEKLIPEIEASEHKGPDKDTYNRIPSTKTANLKAPLIPGL